MRKSLLLMTVFTGTWMVAGTTGMAARAAEAGSSNVGDIQVKGVGTDAAAEPGGGLIIPEDTPKQKSTVTRAFIEEQRPTESPFQVMKLLPGVNTTSDDAYGLSGGKLTVRGFNSDQMGFTVEGVPVNDSGNYAVYPQEFVDLENLEEVFLTQGSVDANAPHVGASGGNIGMMLRNPSETFGGSAAASFGPQDDMHRFYGRLDSGRLATGTKFFIAASDSYADKFRGTGYDGRQHVDAKVVQQINEQSDITSAVLFNYAENYSYRTVTKAQWQQLGRKFDWDSVFSPLDQNYYKLRRNPFDNVIGQVTAHLQLTDNLRLTVEPYIWYGYGNGGGAGQINESRPNNTNNNNWGTFFLNPNTPTDLNGNGRTSDSLLVYAPSITETYRPGVQTQLEYQLDNHKLSAGVWYEHARHAQTGPEIFTNNGVPADIWGREGQILDPATGAPVQYRNWVTINKAFQVFAQDTATWLNDRLTTVLAVRAPWLTRDATNMENGVPSQYQHISKTYNKVLPTIGVNYEFIPTHSIFFNFTENYRAPQNYPFYDKPPVVDNQKAETSYNYDIGYRWQTPRMILQMSLYWVDFYDRQFTAYDPILNLATDTNVGATRSRGVELNSGLKLDDHFTLYGSFSYNNNEMRNDIAALATNGRLAYLPTKGKSYTDTPEYLAGFNLQYAERGFFAGTSAKYTGVRYATLVNDEKTAPFWDLGANAGYHFGGVGVPYDPVLMFNVTNLLDKNYLSTISTARTNAQPVATATGTIAAASAPLYMISPGRTFTLTVSSRF